MASTAALTEAARLTALFKAAGAVPVLTELLQPAEVLLDLYGEDIRGRAYVTHDPVRGELMLRPDFTVPVVQMHMSDGAEPARYTYQGDVFRMQDAGTGRASEYLQVGFEIFDRSNPPEADAEVFQIFDQALGGFDLRCATGDIGILRAAVVGLSTSEHRRAALMRHIWRPARFRALLERFAGSNEAPTGRADTLAALEKSTAPELVSAVAEQPGLRSASEVESRLNLLKEDAKIAPLPGAEYEAINTILNMSTKLADAVTAFDAVAEALPSIKPALQTLRARAQALEARGIDTKTLPFEGNYGRTNMEYYDGFVFGFYAAGSDNPLASGGRYDALTRVLGQGCEIPAVGGVIRPELTAAL